MMKHSAPGTVLLSLCIPLFALGCSEREEQSVSAGKGDMAEQVGPRKGQATPNFVKAEIVKYFSDKGEADERSQTITDKQQVERLASFFSHLGEGRSSPTAATWEPEARIRFFRPDGGSVAVTIDSNYELWSEGQGDWPLPAEFEDYFQKLAKD